MVTPYWLGRQKKLTGQTVLLYTSFLNLKFRFHVTPNMFKNVPSDFKRWIWISEKEYYTVFLVDAPSKLQDVFSN